MKGHTDDQLIAKCDAVKHAVARFVETYKGDFVCDEILEHEIDSLQVLIKEAKGARKELEERKQERYPAAT